jgi:hypothetical protein
MCPSNRWWTAENNGTFDVLRVLPLNRWPPQKNEWMPALAPAVKFRGFQIHRRGSSQEGQGNRQCLVAMCEIEDLHPKVAQSNLPSG